MASMLEGTWDTPIHLPAGRYCTPNYYAKVKGVHVQTVYRRCRSGHIPDAVNIGSTWLIRIG